MPDMYDLIAERLKLIANPNRFRIASHLRAGELSVGDIETQLGIRQPTLSREIARLRDGGVITPRRQGKTVFYEIIDPKMIDLISAVETATIGGSEAPQAQKLGGAKPDFNPKPKFADLAYPGAVSKKN